MNGFVDIYTIIFLILAIVIFLRLRGVLGRRTGNERRPTDAFRRQADRPADKVVTLPPRRNGERAPVAPAVEDEATVEERLRTVAAPDSSLGEALKTLMSADRSFVPADFITGARAAYEMIVTAFAEGDRKTLRQLLSREVYDGFVAAIGEREQRHETIEFKFVGIDKADFVDASLKGGTAQVTVRFVSQLISATRDKDGKVVDGDATKVADVTDVWTFARDVASRDPNWKLVATESVD